LQVLSSGCGLVGSVFTWHLIKVIGRISIASSLLTSFWKPIEGECQRGGTSGFLIKWVERRGREEYVIEILPLIALGVHSSLPLTFADQGITSFSLVGCHLQINITH
jgi:hypothetical protein